VRVAWRTASIGDGPHRLVVDWREEGGPPVKPPIHRGFGSRLIERSIRDDVDGETIMAFEPQGLHCRIALRLSAA